MLNEEEKQQLASMAEDLMSYCQKHMGFKKPPELFFINDEENAKDVLGKTAHYDPQNKRVGIYTVGRHFKDILRSLAHELVHHTQNLRGDFDREMDTSPGYAQKDPNLRKMEAEAYLLGNMLFRDWEDGKKKTSKGLILKLNERKTIMKDKIRELVRKHLMEMLSEEEAQTEAISMPSAGKTPAPKGRRAKRPGHGGPTKEKGLAPEKDELKEEADIFAPNHYCVHHGGVHHNGNVELAEAVGHNFNEELGRVTHYDMKLADGTVLENVAFEDIQVTNASLAKEHKHAMKRDDEEELEEGHYGDHSMKRDDEDDLDEAHCGKRDDDEELDEAEKPDFPDVDGDGDREEPISKASKEKKEKGGDDKKSDKDVSKVPPQLRKHVKGKMKESRVMTHEKLTNLYESRFGQRDANLFDRLKKAWIKEEN
jgi:hypothetical protein